MLRLKTFCAAAALMMSAIAPCFADDVPELTFATISPGDRPLNMRMLHPWVERVNEAGKGIVHITVRDGVTVANYNNIYDRVLDNVVQIAFTITGSVGGKFALSNVVELPMLYEHPDEASVAYWRLYKSGALDSEYTEIVPLFLGTLSNGGFHLSRTPSAPDDIRGFKIAASTRIISQIIELLGATPNFFQQNDMYTALQRKVIDGTYGGWTSFAPFKLGEVTNYHIEAKMGGAAAMVFMARKTFEGLPPAARKVIEDNSGEGASRAFGTYWMTLDNEGREQFKHTAGHTIVDLTPEQLQAWRTKIQPVYAQWFKETPKGEETLAAYRKLLAEVGKEH